MLCGRVTNLLSAYIDRELGGAEMLQVRAHLAGCDACRREHAELTEMKSLLVRMPAVAPRGEFVRATVRRLHATPVPERRRGFGTWWGFLPALRLGPSARVAVLAASLAVAMVATGAALQQPVTRDAVVAGLPRAGMEDWRVRPWEAVVARGSAWRAFWVGVPGPATAPEEQWLLLSLARPVGHGHADEPAPRLVPGIAHRQPIGLSWVLE